MYIVSSLFKVSISFSESKPMQIMSEYRRWVDRTQNRIYIYLNIYIYIYIEREREREREGVA